MRPTDSAWAEPLGLLALALLSVALTAVRAVTRTVLTRRRARGAL